MIFSSKTVLFHNFFMSARRTNKNNSYRVKCTSKWTPILKEIDILYKIPQYGKHQILLFFKNKKDTISIFSTQNYLDSYRSKSYLICRGLGTSSETDITGSETSTLRDECRSKCSDLPTVFYSGLRMVGLNR